MVLAAQESEERMGRDDILDLAKSVVDGDREEMYGKPEESFYLISRLWSDYLDEVILPEDVAMMMVLLKVARSKNVFNIDNYIDIAGYAACGGEIAVARSEGDLQD